MDFIQILNKIRRHTKKNTSARCDGKLIKGQLASDLIKSYLVSDNPAMVCRFGASELEYLINALIINKWKIRKYLKYIKKEINMLTWHDSIINNMINWSGFYPHTEENARKYTKLMLEDIRFIDILGSWLDNEVLLQKKLTHVKYIPLKDMEPYFHINPWSEVLRGKKVLVMHPFEESIQSQYKKRKLLFADKRVLPDFVLITYKTIQTIGGSQSAFKDWFEALEFMKNEIGKLDFDIAIIGCGAYGFNLAAHVKRLGKKAIHLGGAVQILFGIAGRRWENNDNFKRIINKYWTRPVESEIPMGIVNVEDGENGGHYW